MTTDDAPTAATDAEVPPSREAVPLSTLGLSAGSRVEVCWDVEMDDGTEESVWWGATVDVRARSLARTTEWQLSQTGSQ